MGAAPILTILKGGETLRSVPLGDEAVVGRAEGCVIRLDDRAISREHALFRKIGESIQVEKKSEFAPLIVNGAECTTAVLNEGDVISIGPYLLKLSLGARKANSPGPAKASAPPASTDAFAAPAPGGITQDSLSPSPEAAEAPAPATSSMARPGDEGTDIDLALGLDAPDGMRGTAELPEVLELNSEEISSVTRGPEHNTGSQTTRPLDPGNLQVRLVFKPGDANVTELPISQDEISIGRGKDCDIVLNDKKASRKNAVIVRQGLTFVIRDLGSSNGTYVNGERVTERELAGDDRILIGDVTFTFQALQAGYEDRAKEFMEMPREEAAPNLGIDAFEADHAMDAADGALPVDPSDLPDFAGAPLGFRGEGANRVGGIGFDAASGVGGIAGIASPGTPGKKESLIDKFKRQPPRTRLLIGAVLIGGLYFAFFNDGDESAKKGAKPAAVAGASGQTGTTGGTGQTGAAQTGTKTADEKIAEQAFTSLTPEQKRFIEAQHDLAFTYYKNKDYDKALFEIAKVFALVQDYKDSREIERYAREGKRKLEASAEEKKRKEEEAELKRKITELVDKATQLMEHKQFPEASDLFTQILALDPENAAVANWQKQLQAIEEEKKVEAQKKDIRDQINQEAWDVLTKGVELKNQGKYHAAIRVFRQVAEVGASDEKVNARAKKEIARCFAKIARIVAPMMAEGKKAEDDGDFVKAIQMYEKVLSFEPATMAAEKGVGRLRGILHDRARTLYTEAVLAESYSDFGTAQKKFKECLATAPSDDVYHDRSKRKLSHYFREQETATQ